jgi:hypothetical protein
MLFQELTGEVRAEAVERLVKAMQRVFIITSCFAGGV